MNEGSLAVLRGNSRPWCRDKPAAPRRACTGNRGKAWCRKLRSLSTGIDDPALDVDEGQRSSCEERGPLGGQACREWGNCDSDERLCRGLCATW